MKLLILGDYLRSRVRSRLLSTGIELVDDPELCDVLILDDVKDNNLFVFGQLSESRPVVIYGDIELSVGLSKYVTAIVYNDDELYDVMERLFKVHNKYGDDFIQAVSGIVADYLVNRINPNVTGKT